jgi:hypothetical protein
MIMDSGVPLAPSFTATSPVTFTHFMGTNPLVFHNGMQNYDTQSMPWVSNHFPLNMPIHSSEGMMAPLYASSFERSLIPQPTLTVGGWNLPSYGSNPSHTFSGANAQMGGYSTYYTPSMYPSSAMPVPTNTLPMAGPHMSSSISYGGNQFYGMGYPLHGTPSHGGNTYPHLNNPYHTFVSSQTFMDQLCDDARTNLYGSIRRRILPFQTGTGCKPGPFLACNFSKPVFPGTLVSNATTNHRH